MTHTIHIKGITKRFGRLAALDSVSFEVPALSIFGLLGPNGAGKTTLFSIIANFLKPAAGEVEVLGINTRHISRLQGRMSILPQDARFQRNVPILEQLVFFRLLDGQTKEQAQADVLETLKLVGLESVAKRRVGSLSHGMIKRLGIAQAFLGRPEVILLDEPTAGLDPANARQIRDLIKSLQQRATIMVSSHNMAEIQELCDHVAILNHGKLVLAGPVDAITRGGREFQITLSRPLQIQERDALESIRGIRQIKDLTEAVNPQPTNPNLTTNPTNPTNPANYLVTLDLTDETLHEDAVLAALLRNLLDRDITPRKITDGRSLETHFLELTNSSNPAT